MVTLLLVDAQGQTQQRIAAALEGLGTARCVLPEEACSIAATHAADGLVICLGPDVPLDVLGELAELCPDTPRLALSLASTREEVLELVNHGRVNEIFPWPAGLQDLRAAVGRAAATQAWGKRCDEITAGFHHVLQTGRSLAELADASARALFGLLEGRAVLVQLWDEGGLIADGVRVTEAPDLHWVEAERGGEMSSDLYNRSLRDGQRVIGELVVDLGGESGAASVRPRVREIVERIAGRIELAAGARIRQRQADRAMHGALMALGSLVGAREQGTGRQVERLAEYTRLLANALRAEGLFTAELTDEGIDDIVRAVPLHDVGKLAVPDATLLKPGELSLEEWKVIETHPAIGAKVFEGALALGGAPRFLHLARDAARDHHECWDGSGYPRGVAGEHIPLVARIIAVAGVYDALTSHRPYRPALDHAEAVLLLESLAGTQLDPRIVGAFLARANEVDQVRERLRDEITPRREDRVGA